MLLLLARAHAVSRTPRITEDDDRFYQVPQIASSVRRYTTQDGSQVIEQGNKRIVIHNTPPPRRYSSLVLLGAGMILAFILFLLGSLLVNWWTAHQLDTQYGYPRIWQTDQVVGHSDNEAHPTHFIIKNLHGHIIIIEICGGEASKSKIYVDPTVFGGNADQLPATAIFSDVNGDGKIDMIVNVGGEQIVFLNTGTQFKQQ